MSLSRKFLTHATLAALLLSASASALSPRPASAISPSEPGFSPGNQYTATLDQTNNRWRLQPVDGDDFTIDTGTCATGTMVAPGVWLLVLDDQGRPELVAPSVTALPPGHAGRVALRACNKAQAGQLAVPQRLLDLLAATTSAVYVTR